MRLRVSVQSGVHDICENAIGHTISATRPGSFPMLTSSEQCMTSIVIPAHNEEIVIERCLRPFLKTVQDKDFEVIVVCNGCTDQTARVVSDLSDKFVCIETDKASKTHALNIGDQAARSFPRIYLDADVSLSTQAVSALGDALDSGYLAVSTEVKMDLSDSTWPVRAYYDVWLSLPYCKAGMVGTGVYALSEQGRNRFDQFPELIADDGYVRCLFNESERGVTHGHYSVVTAPRNFAGLLKIKTRSRLGRYQLKEKYPEIMKNEEKDYGKAMKPLLLDIRSWPKIFLYLIINVVTRLRASWQMKNNMSTWERDDSSRRKTQA